MNVVVLVILSLLALCAAADETEDPMPVSKEAVLAITRCHPGDPVLIHVTPIPENAARLQGWFTTTNDMLNLRDLSMLPSGLNRLDLRTVCRGLTGEVSSVVIDLQRPPPPPKVSSRRVRKVPAPSPVPTRFSTASNGPPPFPPIPPGMAGMLPLPGSPTNKISYHDQAMMKAYFSKQGRRSE